MLFTFRFAQQASAGMGRRSDLRQRLGPQRLLECGQSLEQRDPKTVSEGSELPRGLKWIRSCK